ncbi:MAG: DUF4912 domain-containing protein [Candidatus Omnitrophica bacterium]|nr:DUF4912 domain-containing protein [Candidatus Omnitrophota bacterium]MDD5670140.1 DUF4912 domain-containing protein [Candidatus Omnitrophota bacterium]
MPWFRGKKKAGNGNSAKNKKEGKEVPEKKETVNKRSLAFKAATRQPKSMPPSPPAKKPEKKAEEASAPRVATTQMEMPKREPLSELPWNYGDNQIYLMVRDPYWLFSYWEIQKDHQEKKLKELGGSWDGVCSVVRVYDVTEQRRNAPFFDIVLQGNAHNWYVNAQPNHSYFVEIGLLHRDGRFVALARSNEITTPRAGMSEVIDEQWMGIDFDKMYALSGGFEVGKSSMELKQLMEERLRGAISSGSGGVISSLASPVKIHKKRGFWFILDCELIVYGATEPDAKVTVQGKEVKLRPDGTFTLRFALPDGKYVIDAHAESADGIEERVIIPIVQRHTERPAPIFKSKDKK